MTDVGDKTIQDPPIEKIVGPTVIHVATSAPGPYCRNRQFEWVMTWAMLFGAIILLISPNALKHSRFWMVTEFGIGQTAVMVYFASFGILGALSLYWNGAWRFGAKVRAICAGARAVAWSQLMLALFASSTIDAMSLSIGVFLALTLGELKSCYRAVIDDKGTR